MTFETGGIYFLYTLIYIGFALGLKLVLNFKASAYYKADDMDYAEVVRSLGWRLP